MSTIPITKNGAERLKEELHNLKHKERPAVINAISEARAQGDLSENAEYGSKMTYQIVGDDEADIEANKISISSPIARALISKEAGDVVAVAAPAGQREVEILSVRYI